MKCNWCSFRSVSRQAMVDHIKHSHRAKVVSKISGQSNPTAQTESEFYVTDALLLSTIASSFSDFADDRSFSGGGGSFDGGGASGSWDSGSSSDSGSSYSSSDSSSSSDSGSCGGCD